MSQDTHADTLQRIAMALENIQARLPAPVWSGQGLREVTLGIWHGLPEGLRVMDAGRLASARGQSLLDGQGHYPVLEANVLAFAQGKPANHILLWGARGTGKSSMVRKACAEMLVQANGDIGVIEILQQGLGSLSDLLGAIAQQPARRFLLLLDDLAYEEGASAQGYNALKSLLEGSLLVMPGQILVVATSNRRHLVSESAMEQDSSRILHAKESIEERVSLSDRFGLWLGFPSIDQEQYLAMVAMHLQATGLAPDVEQWRHDALEWAITRGGRSGRVAAQFVRSLA